VSVLMPMQMLKLLLLLLLLLLPNRIVTRVM
jgi:hypothetical protein